MAWLTYGDLEAPVPPRTARWFSQVLMETLLAQFGTWADNVNGDGHVLSNVFLSTDRRATFSGVPGSSIDITGSAGTSRSIALQTAGANRFRVGLGAIAESGSNAGSNFIIERFNDAGTLIDTALRIDRATGMCTVIGLESPVFFRRVDSAEGGQINLDDNTRPWSFDVLSGSLRIFSTSPTTINPLTINSGGYILLSGLGNYANDSAASAGGVPVGGLYRNGSVLMVRVS